MGTDINDVVIIGGGLAGLVSANLLAKAGLKTVLIERKKYPFHRVCGEYVSNETLAFLQQNQLFPSEFNPTKITRLLLSSPKGNIVETALDLGGFGISRYHFDDFLYKQALKNGSGFLLGHKVNEVHFNGDFFDLKVSDGSTLKSKMVIGAFGKRSNIDKELQRPFMQKRSPYIGVKYHITNYNFPRDSIALYNFKDGYCGVNAIEDNRLCLCYLTSRQNLKDHGNIEAMEREVLFKNPLLKKLWQESEFLYEKPEVINEISFEKKEAVVNHVLMSGDAAGMITPLCGNGMAMAIHSAKILSEEILQYFQQHQNREILENNYTAKWNNLFARRLWIGRKVQSLFGKPVLSEIAVAACKNSKPLLNFVMKQTHGKPF
ncbi:MAG: NAD(P)/FAD-dependent oxidoreductase [Bacteroidia bacterium]